MTEVCLIRGGMMGFASLYPSYSLSGRSFAALGERDLPMSLRGGQQTYP